MTRAAALALLLALAACATARSEHALIGSPGTAHDRAVAIFREGEEPPDDYEEVALVSATTGSPSTVALLALVQEEAARLGCDAVLRLRVDVGRESATAIGVAVRRR